MLKGGALKNRKSTTSWRPFIWWRWMMQGKWNDYRRNTRITCEKSTAHWLMKKGKRLIRWGQRKDKKKGNTGRKSFIVYPWRMKQASKETREKFLRKKRSCKSWRKKKKRWSTTTTECRVFLTSPKRSTIQLFQFP